MPTDLADRTFAEAAAWWVQNKLALHRPVTRSTMGFHLKKHLLPRLGTLLVRDITEERAQELIATLAQQITPRGRPLAPVSIRDILTVLRLILGRHITREWALSYPKAAVREQRFFTPDEMRAIISRATGHWRVLFALLAGTGVRIGEACALSAADIDFENLAVTVRRSAYKGIAGPLKTARGYRRIQIDPGVAALLKTHLAGRTTGPVFHTRTGRLLLNSNVRVVLHKILRHLRLPMGGLHSFRHGRVSVLRAAGVPDELVLEWVGHSSLRTTARYTHFEDAFRSQIAHRLGLDVRATV